MAKKRDYKYSKQTPIFKHSLKFLFKVFLILLILFSIAGYATFNHLLKNLPDPTTISANDKIESTKIYDKTGKILLYDIHGEEKRTIVDSLSINQYIKDATLAAEDDDFYMHKGIDFKAILRALVFDILKMDASQGGSTITQQLIKNSFLTPEKTLIRKIKEAILAIKLEKKYTKDQILVFYLNQIPYGSNAYGIESAAQTFFNKPASNLSLAESALLASLPKAPSYYSPYGQHKDALLGRKDYILDRMFKIGYISEDEINKAKSETLAFSQEFKGIKAPHFTHFVKEYLENKYGSEYIQKGGLKVYTTLDFKTQETTENILTEFSSDHLKKYGASNVAAVVLDSKTGQILAMVGSKDYFDIKNEGNFNVITGKRQPGSAFKPIVYSRLLEKGFTPETVFWDVETEFSTTDIPEESYKPKNYDGKFRGPVALKSALAQSLNIPAVKALYIAGIDDILDYAKKLGITTLEDRSRLGLSLVLGGAEVKPIELASAYATFSNKGIKNDLAFILKVEDAKGNILEEWRQNSQRVLDENTAKTITEILSDNSLRAPIFGENNSLRFDDIDVAAKTGTTQEFKDGWVAGYTTDISLVVWVGNNDNTPMNKEPGSVITGPIFNKLVRELSKITVFGNFEPAEKIIRDKNILNGGYLNEVKIKIDKASKKLANEFTPKSMIEEKTFKTTHNLLFYIDKNDILGPFPKNPETDPQYKNWEDGILQWLKEHPEFNYINNTIPQEEDNIHTLKNNPIIKIINPKNTDTSENSVSIDIDIQSPFKIKEVDFYLDNRLVNSDFYYPFGGKIDLSQENYGNHKILIRVYDEYENTNFETLEINKLN